MKQSWTFRLLKKVTWESVSVDKDPNHTFNSFLCSFLSIFQASFSVKYNSMKDKNDQITQEIKISSKHKRNLYVLTKNSNDPKAKVHFIKYCKIVRNVIKEAKKKHYIRRIAKSNNRIKTTWNNIKKETRKVHSLELVPTLWVMKI